MDTRTSLQRLKKMIGGDPNFTLVDVGASDFRWAKDFLVVFPETKRIHGIEANAGHEIELKKVVSQDPRFSYTLAAASDEDGEVEFDGSDLFGGGIILTNKKGTKVKSVSVKNEIKRFGLQAPIFLKVDIHGAEIPMLGEVEFKVIDFIWIEVYAFRLQRRGPYFWEIARELHEKGFRTLDITEVSYRPSGALWQMDLLLAREDFKPLEGNNYND